MATRQLLRDISLETFRTRYLHLVPYSQPGGAERWKESVGWKCVEEVLASDDIDLLVARGGELDESLGASNAQELLERHREGHTLVVRHAERHHETIAELARSFESDYCAPVNVHLYVTPPGEHGFGWHYDAEDVFIIQTRGRKTYALRKNTLQPWPVLELMPRDMQFERERTPHMECTLEAGDWLYIPAGYWHRATAESSDESAISLAAGVLSLTALDFLEFLRRRLGTSLAWRQRLPVVGTVQEVENGSNDEIDEALVDRHAAVLADLRRDLERVLDDRELVREFIRAQRQASEARSQALEKRQAASHAGGETTE